MSKPKYTYNYDYDTNTTTIVSVEKIGREFVTTTKTVEGNQTPQKTFTKQKVFYGLLILGLLNVLLTTIPQLVVTPAAIFGALKLTKDKKTNEKVIAGVGAGVLSLVACSLFVKPPTPSPSSSYSNTVITDSGDTLTRQELRTLRIKCKELIRASGSNDTEQCWKYSDQ